MDYMHRKCVLSAAILLTTIFMACIISVIIQQTQITPQQTSTPPNQPLTTPNNPQQTPIPTPTNSNSQQPSTPTPTPNSTIYYTYTVVQIYPHDTTAFTQGLVYDNGILYESTGGFGDSSLRKINLEGGTILQQLNLPNYFCEGLTIINNNLIQLTWKSQIGFIYDKETLALIGNFSYQTEGWGLTFDGNKLIMSDGSSKLIFLDPLTYQKVGEVNVLDGNTPITSINELQYINGDIYANIWLTQKIAIINPQTGQVKGWIDLTGISQHPVTNPDSVLNGIAYDQQTNRLFVTGKNWSNLYHIELIPVN